MNPTPRQLPKDDLDLITEYLNKGGTVTKCEKYARTEDIEYTGGFYGRRKKQKEEVVVEDEDNEETT